MRRLLLLSGLCWLTNAWAQDSVLEPAADEDSAVFKKVMVIPFNPNLYLADCNHDLIKYNKKHGDEILKTIRYGLDYNVHARVITKYETKQVLRDTSVDVQKDLQSIYNAISYKYEQPSPLVDEKEKKRRSNFFKQLSDKLKADEKDMARFASKYKTYDQPRKYMNVKIYNNEIFSYLYEKYDTDLFLFINQFELITNYERCIDRANGVFEREVMVHFSIFDKTGKQLYGDVVTVVFPSNTNDLDTIIRSNFPLVADYLADKLPQKPLPAIETESYIKEY